MSQERQFAWAPDDTPEWLRTRPSDVARGGEHFVEIDEAIGGEVPEELLAKGWGRVPQSMWDALLSKLSQENLARALYFHALQDDADHHNIGLTRWDARALGYIHVLHNGSPVWWIDLDGGDAPAVAAVTLFDLVVGTRQPAHDDQGHTQMWMLSLDQWDNAEWPAESQGGPPYTKSVSVAREAQDRMDLDAPWPPAEADAHGVLHTQIEMPKGPPRWLGYGRTPLIAVRINTYLWGEILRADGYAAWNAGNISSETPEESIERHARFLLDILEGARRTEGDGSLAPNNVYIDAAHYFEPRVRFLKYGSGDEPKRGMWAGLGFFKKESIRELLTNVIVTHEGSTVWLYDLEAGKPDRVLTLWEMIGDWFGDINDENLVANRVGARKIHGGFGPVPIYFFDFDTKKVRGYYDVETKKKLWPMSEAQWESGEWPSVDVGGPPAAKYGMEAAEAAREKYVDPTAREVIAPNDLPQWLISGQSRGGSLFGSAYPLVRVSIPEENEDFIDEQGRYSDWSDFVGHITTFRPNLANVVRQMYRRALTLRRMPGYDAPRADNAEQMKELKTLETGLGAIDIFHGESPVWWVDLDDGPVQAATLFDLATVTQPAGLHDGKIKMPGMAAGNLWLMSLDQWDNAEWPAESQGGPPYTPHVSVSRENPMAAEDGDDDAALICMGRHIILELEDCDDVELPARWGMLHDPSGIFWPKCSLLFCKFSQGQQSDSSDEGVGYFGKKADVRRGRAHMPLPDLHNGWHEVGIVKQVFYERAGKHEGRYKHKFNDPRGWMWLVALFKRRVAETPPILFEYNCGGLQALRLELPDGCAVDDRGIALP